MVAWPVVSGVQRVGPFHTFSRGSSVAKSSTMTCMYLRVALGVTTLRRSAAMASTMTEGLVAGIRVPRSGAQVAHAEFVGGAAPRVEIQCAAAGLVDLHLQVFAGRELPHGCNALLRGRA